MWVIANGAPKNGSTWLVQLLRATDKFERIPKKFQNVKWNNPSVDKNFVEEAAQELSNSEYFYFSKQHWPNCYAQLLNNPGIKMVNIIRDARDVCVSRYHHNVRKHGENLSIGEFISNNAQNIISNLSKYHNYWIQKAIDGSSKNYYITCFEQLKYDLFIAAASMYSFLEFNFSEDSIKNMAEKTLFSNKSNVGPGKFFRKGEAFGFKDEIGTKEEKIIIQACKKYELDKVKKQIAHFNPVLTEYLKNTDIGLS